MRAISLLGTAWMTTWPVRALRTQRDRRFGRREFHHSSPSPGDSARSANGQYGRVSQSSTSLAPTRATLPLGPVRVDP
jgi:hypothetical protein